MQTEAELRNKIIEFRARLSTATVSRMTNLATDLQWHPDELAVDLFFRAAGNVIDTDIRGNQDAAAYRRCLEILQKALANKQKAKAFEKSHLLKAIDHKEAMLPEIWVTRFVQRLSEETRERIVRLASDYGRETAMPPEVVRKAATLSELAFRKYERDVLLPSLDAEEEKAVENELLKMGFPVGSSPEFGALGDKRKNWVVVAPVKYKDEHFKEVDELQGKGYKQAAALNEVFEKHFDEERDSREGFEKQYRLRWLNRKVKGGGR